MGFDKNELNIDSEKLLQVSFDAIQDGISILDADLKILKVNKVMEQWYSSAMPVHGKKCYEVYHGFDQPCSNCPTLQSLKSGKPAVEVVPLTQKGRQTGWLELFTYPLKGELNNIVGVVEFVRDITARRKAEAALRERENLYRATLYSIGDAVITTDESACIRHMNHIAENLTGWEEAEARGRSLPEVFKIINEQTRDLVDNPAEKVLREGLIIGLANHSLLIRRDGTEIPIADSGAPIKSEAGDVTGVVIVFRDMSDEMEKYKAIEEAERRAVRQRAALSFLSVDSSLASGNLPQAIKVLLEKAAEALQTERNSIWLFSEDDSILKCISLYEASLKKFSKGSSLQVEDYPNYFKAICSESRISVSDVLQDPRTNEMTESYIKPLGITSMLDAGIFYEGKLVGVVCFEHAGDNRKWHPDDESFASTIASLFGQVLALEKRNEAESVLQAEREQLLSIFDSINEIVYVSDPYTYELLYMNKKMRERFSKKILGEKCYKVLQGKNEPCEFCTNEIILKNKNTPYRWEHYNPVLKKTYAVTDQLIKWPDGRDVRFEIAFEISDRKKLEQLLEDSSEWYRTIAEDIPILVNRLSPDMRFTFVNDAYCNFYGLTGAEILDKELIEFVPPENRALVKEALLSLTPEKPIQRHEHFNLAKSGETRWVKWTNRALFDAEGTLKEYLSVGEDITEQKKTETELKTSEQRNRALVDALPDMLFLYSKEG
ncbi:MAG: PAS domain S-box protein, partial [Bacillota bacterium]